jgi:hypothetical protein
VPVRSDLLPVTALPGPADRHLHLVPAPAFDSDQAAVGAAPESITPVSHAVPVQGALALSFDVGRGVPAVPVTRPRLVRNVPCAPTAGRTDTRRFAAMLVQGVVEVMSGDRPLGQLARWTTMEVYEELQWRARRATATAAVRLGRPKARVNSVHVYEPHPEAAEVCATVRWSGRTRALALRMEPHGDGWRCTAVSLG